METVYIVEKPNGTEVAYFFDYMSAMVFMGPWKKKGRIVPATIIRNAQ